MAPLSVREQGTRSRRHIESGKVGGEGGGQQSQRSRSKTIPERFYVVVDRAMLKAATQLQPQLEAALKVPPRGMQQNNNMRHAAHDTRRATPDAPACVRHKPGKSRFFYAPSASAENALQSNWSGVSRMHACVR